MGACCCGDKDENEDDEIHQGNPGPDIERGCTDTLCIVPFATLTLCLVYVAVFLLRRDCAKLLNHGRDHYGQFCGDGDMKTRPFTFYPDLANDWRTPYGICLEVCPNQSHMVDDYDGIMMEGYAGEAKRRDRWYVAKPVFPLFNRCIPYKAEPNFTNALEFCASPPCIGRSDPEGPRDVCGLQRDGTDRFWLLGEADDTVKEGWKSEGVTHIDKRARIAADEAPSAKTECEAIVLRDVRVMPVENKKLSLKGVAYEVLTKYTGFAFRWGSTVYKRWPIVVGLGIGGALVSSLAVISLFAWCVEFIMAVLAVLLFAVLILFDYILLFQASVVTGKTGLAIISQFENGLDIDVPDAIEGMLSNRSEDEFMLRLYKIAAVAFAIFIVLLASMICAMWKQIEIMVALFQETSRTIRQMPSLLVFPLLLVVSMIFASLMFLYLWLGVATVGITDVQNLVTPLEEYGAASMILDGLGLTGDDALHNFQRICAWTLIFSFVWVYFFHVALFIMITAMTMSHWYFYRDDPERNHGSAGMESEGWYFGKPVLVAYSNVLSYHVGTLALGSFICAVVTMPRLVLEYIVQQAEDEKNTVTQAIVWVLRSCLCCLERCVELVTEYAYVYVAVTGKPFCASARNSFTFFATYPVQVSLDKMASFVLGCLACITVPLSMLLLSFTYLPRREWAPCGVFIVVLAYVTTRLAVGVYDVAVTTLLICCMHDVSGEFKKSGVKAGRYMPEGLAAVVGLPCTDRSPDDKGMEMQTRS